MTDSQHWLEMRSFEANRGTLMHESGVTQVMVFCIRFTHPDTDEVLGVEFVFDLEQTDEIVDAIQQAVTG